MSSPSCRIVTLSRTFLCIVISLAAFSLASAQTTTWNGASTTPNDNLWSNDGNWTNGNPADQNVVFTNADALATPSPTPTPGYTPPTPNSIVDEDYTVRSLTYSNVSATSANWQYTEINSEVTLTLETDLSSPEYIFMVGSTTSVDGQSATRVKIGGEGSMVINESDSDIFISNRSTNNIRNATLEMATLANFSATVRNVLVGNGTRSSGTWNLADTNTFTMDLLSVGYSTSSSEPSNGTLTLGRINTLNVDSIFVGAAYASGNAATGTIQFQTFAAGIIPTVTIRGTNSTEENPTRANLTIGSHGSATNRTALTGLVDFTGGSVDALLGDIVIGDGRGILNSSRTGNVTGTLAMGSGIIDSRSVVLGRSNSSSTAGTATGNLNIVGAGAFTTGSVLMADNAGGAQNVAANIYVTGGGTFEVVQSVDEAPTTGSITMGNKTGTATTVVPTIHLSGNGLLTVTGNIAEGTSSANITSTINILGGFLDMDQGAISVDTVNFVAGGVKNLGNFKNGSGASDQPLIKSGNGVGILSGTNGYAGGTTVSGGVLLVDSGSLSPNGTVTVGSNSALVLDYTGIQSDLNALVSESSSGSIALTWKNASESVDFSSAGANLSDAFLGAFGQVTYSGTYTPFAAGEYRLGGGTGTLDYASDITGSSSVTIGGGPGTVILSGSNDFTGGVSLLAGSLLLTSLDDLGAASNDLTFNGGGLEWATGSSSDISSGRTVTLGANGAVLDTNGNNVTLASAIGNGGTGGLTKSGAGILSLQGLNTFSGGLTVSGGSVELDLSTNTSGVLSAGSPLALTGGTLSVKGASSGASSQTLGNLTLTGANRITIDPNGGSATTLQLGDTWTRNVGATLALDLPVGAQIASNPSVQLQNGILPYATVNGTDFATVSGGNIVAYSGYTTISSGNSIPGNNVSFATTNYKIAGGSTNMTISDASNVGYMNSLVMTDSSAHSITINQNRTVRFSSIGSIYLASGAGNLNWGSTSQNTTVTAGGPSQNLPGELILINDSSSTFFMNSGIGNNGTGVVSVTKSGSGLVSMGGGPSASGFTGTLTLNEGTWNIVRVANGGSSSDIGAATSAASNLVFNGGTLRYSGTGGSTDRLFTIGLGGSTIDANGSGALAFTNFESLGYSGNGKRTLTLTGTNSGDNTLSAWVGDNGGSTSLTKTGAGKWIIAGYNDYSGATRVTAGTLIVNGSLGAGSAVSVENASTILGGDGTINGSVSILSGATLSPGDGSIATLKTGGIALSSTSNIALTLGGTVAGTSHDQLDVTGLISLGTEGNLSLTLDYAPVGNPIFTLIANDGSDAISGMFATINGAAFGAANTFQLTYNSVAYDAQLFYTGNGNSTTGGNDLVVQITTAIPEPSTWALIAAGAIGCWFTVRRKRLQARADL